MTTTNNSTYLQLYNDEYARKHITVITFLAFIMVTGVIGNSIICYVYLLRFKPSPTRSFVVISALLDILNCLLCIPMKIDELRNYVTFGSSAMCWLSAMAAIFFSFSISLVQLVIAVDRYKRICRPYQKQMTVFTAHVACGIASFLCLTSVSPVPVIRGRRTVDLGRVNGTICWYPDEQARLSHRIYTAFLMLMFSLTIVSLLILYTCIWSRVYRQRKLRKTLNPSPHVSYNTRPGTVDIVINITRESSFGNSTESVEARDLSSEQSECLSIADRSINSGETSSIPKVKSGTSKRRTRNRLQDKAVMNITITVFIVTFMGVICFIPYFIVTALATGNENFFDLLTDVEYVIVTICAKSYFLHSAINPFIYSIFNASFRRELGITCKKRYFVKD